jgi:hypothetical protein
MLIRTSATTCINPCNRVNQIENHGTFAKHTITISGTFAEHDLGLEGCEELLAFDLSTPVHINLRNGMLRYVMRVTSKHSGKFVRKMFGLEKFRRCVNRDVTSMLQKC